MALLPAESRKSCAGKLQMSKEKTPAYAVILAGGRGTRFWPHSRRRTPKQLLNIVGRDSMVQQAVARLSPLLRPAHTILVTNDAQLAAVRKHLPRVPRSQFLSEPMGRNTAAAIGLAAIHLRHKHGDALMAVLPADHYIAQPAKFRALVKAALHVASSHGQIAVLGVPPTRPETGFGYIEREGTGFLVGSARVFAVRRFTEKPSLAKALWYIASRHYLWNAGMFFMRASTYMHLLRKFLPRTHAVLESIAPTIGTPRYSRVLRNLYRHLENISVDFAILEPATRQRGPRVVHVLPAEVGWSDIGSWESVYELLTSAGGKRSTKSSNFSAGPCAAIDASGNFLWIPGKFVAAVGVRDLVVVETPDALLICARDRAQDVGKVVKWLEARKLEKLL
jgi:mannose-1-phosphate guanylyltransferase